MSIDLGGFPVRLGKASRVAAGGSARIHEVSEGRTDADDHADASAFLGWRILAPVKPLKVYSYKKCGTCRKALKWLEDHDKDFEVIDIVAHPPDESVLRRVLNNGDTPLKKLFNTSGQSYREGDFATRLPTMSEKEKLAALTADGKLIKRPLVLGDDVALVGFRPEDYEQALS